MSSTTRMLLAVALSAAIVFAWLFLFGPKQTDGERRDGAAGQPGGPDRGVPAPASRPAGAPTSRPAEAGESKSGPVVGETKATLVPVRRPDASGVFTSRGAALKSWKLLDPQFQEVRQGKLVAVDLVQTQPPKGPWPLTTTFAGSDFDVPEHAAFSVASQGPRGASFVWESDKVRVLKHYVVDKVRPVIWMTLRVRNLAGRSLRHRLRVSLYNRQDPSKGQASFTNPYPAISTVLCYVNGELHRRSASAIRGEDSGCTAAGCGMGEGPVTQTGHVLWVGSDNRYFFTALVPLEKEAERRCELSLLDDGVVHAALQFPQGEVKAQETIEHRFAVYVGAKHLDELDALRGLDNAETHLSESIEYGWFAILCRPMLWLLKVFYSAFGNWGVAIILLTIVVKLLTLYWTQKSMRSMKEMQRLKPKIDVLREKFKDDKERLNQEMMALYRVHKVNPLGGCLPMLIQMPIWFALYRTLGNAVELYRSNFVGWITDLTAPDPYYVLPIAMGISMYAQQAISPQPMEGAQAKMMKYFMPGLFTVMMLALPSGLTLYIFVNTVLTMIHQWYMNKTDPDKSAVVKEAKSPSKEGSGGEGKGIRRGRKNRRKNP